jgi:hypothetical protein
LRWTIRAGSFPVNGPGQATNLHLHQTLRGKINHLAQKIAISRLPNQRLHVHLVLGHRCLRKLSVATQAYPKFADDPPRI